MKKTITMLFAMLVSVAMWADAEGGTLTSSAAPINPTETVTLSYDGTGTNFANWTPMCFIHTWLVAKEGKTFSTDYGTEWADCNGDANYNALPDKVKMTFVETGKYTISMNIKSFFDVADEDLEKIDKIGVIVRAQYPGDNNKTIDFFINVEVPAPVVTLYFVNVPGWETVKAFVWPATGNAYKEWSGEAMTKTETKVNGYDVYSYTFPSNYVNIIFNDGGSNKTADLAWTANKPYFYPETKDGNGRYNAKWYENTAAIPVPVVPTMKVVKLVPSEEWADANAKFAAWIWGSKIEAHWTSFFTPISEGNDTLQAEIISTADSIDFVRFSPKTIEPTWDKQGDYVVVWNEAKDTIDWKGLTATIKGWGELSWKPVEVPCSGYGLLVDGETYIDGKHDLSKDWTEYYLRSVHLTKGQTLKIKNKCNSDAWVITKFAETSYELEIKDGSYVIAEDGDYDFYIKLINQNDEIFISKAGTYTTAVRPQCTDVMIQAFYNESYNESAAGVDVCGKTRWWNFLNEKAEDGVTSLAEEMGHYFDLVWLPPSANGSGMGYHPKKYSDQNSTWGTWDELASLIGTLHSAGSKVVADIVINHCEGWTSWCDFPMLDFGEYGTFSPDQSYICQNDEVNGEWNKDKAGSCYGKASGSYDDGENWDGARDWSHNDVYVQNMFKAYLKWMRNVVGYDGFRYDKGDGFNNWHHDNYNKAAGPYIAFMECYSNTDEIWWRIQQANYNLMGLDFDTKWHVFDAFAGWDYDGKYGKPRGDGLLGRNNGRYAVEFIDSHDWFGRGNGCEFGGDGNSLKQELLPRLLVANAFMLSMPGVPCVFYPHWAKYKGFLKNMIEARKLAGVHSESEVKDEYFDENGYQATIVGKDGFLILCLGNKAHASGFDGFTLMSSYYAENDCNSGKDGSHQIWVKRTTPLPTGLENEQKNDVQSIKGEKFVKDGKLYIRLGEKVYDILGQTIK